MVGVSVTLVTVKHATSVVINRKKGEKSKRAEL